MITLGFLPDGTAESYRNLETNWIYLRSRTDGANQHFDRGTYSKSKPSQTEHTCFHLRRFSA